MDVLVLLKEEAPRKDARSPSDYSASVAAFRAWTAARLGPADGLVELAEGVFSLRADDALRPDLERQPFVAAVEENRTVRAQPKGG